MQMNSDSKIKRVRNFEQNWSLEHGYCDQQNEVAESCNDVRFDEYCTTQYIRWSHVVSDIGLGKCCS